MQPGGGYQQRRAEILRRSDRYGTGKVWQFHIDRESFEQVLDKTMVVHHIQDGDTIQVRYLSVGSPYEGAVEVEPNLEDAYLCLLKNMEGKSGQ